MPSTIQGRWAKYNAQARARRPLRSPAVALVTPVLPSAKAASPGARRRLSPLPRAVSGPVARPATYDIMAHPRHLSAFISFRPGTRDRELGPASRLAIAAMCGFLFYRFRRAGWI